jgi:hypothetical protein
VKIVAQRKKMPSIAEIMSMQGTALRLAEGSMALWALQAKMVRMQFDLLQRSQKLTLKAINATTPLWQPALLASFQAPSALLRTLRSPWAR